MHGVGKTVSDPVQLLRTILRRTAGQCGDRNLEWWHVWEYSLKAGSVDFDAQHIMPTNEGTPSVCDPDRIQSRIVHLTVEMAGNPTIIEDGGPPHQIGTLHIREWERFETIIWLWLRTTFGAQLLKDIIFVNS